ncbi:eukaryotic aspartyl protease family protein [Artemisia annua]|uniref:Eukaryotic aspartyl protease family protein n=1 Tax=Artemisia annua TaxID=35608 RepID=A0A2U1Q5X7_ARTAN|nr:eukaryotic aspartyl protease family protein [Artemisia annua]
MHSKGSDYWIEKAGALAMVATLAGYHANRRASSALIEPIESHPSQPSYDCTTRKIRAPANIGAKKKYRPWAATTIWIMCGMIQTDSFLDGASPNGLFGLGMENLHAPSILASSGLTDNSFSMCFIPDGVGIIYFRVKGSLD